MMRGIRIRFLFMAIFLGCVAKKCVYVKKTGKILTRYAAFVFSLLDFHLIVVVWRDGIGRAEDEKDSICGDWISAQPHL